MEPLNYSDGRELLTRNDLEIYKRQIPATSERDNTEIFQFIRRSPPSVPYSIAYYYLQDILNKKTPPSIAPILYYFIFEMQALIIISKFTNDRPFSCSLPAESSMCGAIKSDYPGLSSFDAQSATWMLGDLLRKGGYLDLAIPINKDIS